MEIDVCHKRTLWWFCNWKFFYRKQSMASLLMMNNSLSVYINDSVFLFAHAFISFCTLNFWLEMCFSDRMDGYAKMFTYLFFPLYLILVVILASRHSERMTFATRSLPVFRHIVSNFAHKCTQGCVNSLVLLFYRMSTTKQSSTVSMVYSVPLFGLTFTVLFIIIMPCTFLIANSF